MSTRVDSVRTGAVRIAFVVLILLSAGCSRPSSVSVSAICADRVRYDTKLVVSTGRAENMIEKLSRKGNYYYTFDLVDGDDRVRIFSFGKPQVRDGDTVRVKGIYYKARSVGHYEFEHEIDVTDGYARQLR